MYHFSPKDEDTKSLLNVGADLSNYMASRRRKQWPKFVATEIMPATRYLV
jgi:hypothetical protein